MVQGAAERGPKIGHDRMTRTCDRTQPLALPDGDPHLAHRLIGPLYDELHRSAEAQLRHERPDPALQPAALVHEAFLRLTRQMKTDWNSRGQFLSDAAYAMRRALLDHVRGRERVKRGWGWRRVALAGFDDARPQPDPALLDLEDALERLAATDQRQSRIVELRFFGGMTVEQIAQILGVSKSTVENEWRVARAWFRRELTGAHGR